MIDLSNENVIHVKKGDIEYLQFRKLLEYKDDIEHCFTIKPLDFGDNEKVRNNPEKYKKEYEKFSKEMNWDEDRIVRPFQTHTNIVKCVDKKTELGIYPVELDDVDGVITNKSNIILTLASADCILLLFYDPIKKVIGDTHSGWQGTLKQISKETVKKMISEYGSDPKDIICCMSPSISKENFEVDEDLYEKFYNQFQDLRRTDEIFEKGRIEDGKQKYNIDTVLINRVILEDIGLLPENIIESKLCTVNNSDYIHSYRVDKDKSGRNNAFIFIK